MESIKFPEMTGTYAKSQPQFKTLHLNEIELPDQGKGVKQYTAKYKLSPLEIAQIVKTGSLFSMQVGNCLHPSSVRTENPFMAVPVYYTSTEDGLISATIIDNLGNPHKFTSWDPSSLIDSILAKFEDLTSADQLYFIERSSATIGPEGLEGM